MSQPVTETEATLHLSEYLDRVVRNGESFVIVRGNTTIAELHPVVKPTCLPKGPKVAELPAIIASLPKLSTEEAEAFAQDLEDVQTMMNRMEDVNHWDS